MIINPPRLPRRSPSEGGGLELWERRRQLDPKIMKHSAACHQSDRFCHAYISEDMIMRTSERINPLIQKSINPLNYFPVCAALHTFCEPIQGEAYD